MTANRTQATKPTKAATPNPKAARKALLESKWRYTLGRHRFALQTSFSRLSRSPFATILTTLVIGIALALPASLYLLVKKADVVVNAWHGNGQIALYLDLDTTDRQTETLLQQLKRHHQVIDVRYISPQQGLEEFQQMAGFGNLFSSLPDNPLPAVIEIEPSLALQHNVNQMRRLAAQLKRYPHIDKVQTDLQWLVRLQQLLTIATRATWAIGFLLALGVILIIGHTIYLATWHDHEEVEIMKLVGATDAFVRRPFLYTGMLYGVFGGTIAWLSIDTLIVWLRDPANQLARLYHSQLQLTELGLTSLLNLCLVGASLGILGAYFAVSRYLSTVQE